MSAVEQLVVDGETVGVRLDKLLAQLRSVGSREKARQVLKSGKVTVDGRAVGPDDGGRPLAAGATVEIAWNRPGTGARRTAARTAMDRAGVVVLHEDDAILAADKPAGLLTDAADADQGKHRDTLRKRIHAWVNAEVYPAHRIDRDTTGVVLFAKTPAAQAGLKAQWIERTPRRVYLAVFDGRLDRDHGRFADWMAWDARARIQQPADKDAPGAWLAEATFQVVERFGDVATLVEVSLVTGRRNQIRLHAMLAGHPLLGEPLYRMPGRVRTPFPRQALHARELGLVHPTTHQPITFEAPIPDDLTRLFARLRRA
ncbi:MAG: RluA family pseudouridine synthase [Myxococcota bacterium]